MDAYNEPLYTISDAAYFLRMKGARVRRLLQGSNRTSKTSNTRVPVRPLIEGRVLPKGQASFLDLIELRMTHELLNIFTFQKVRRFHSNLAEQFETPYPFSRRRLYVDSGTLVAEFACDGSTHMMDAGQSGQIVIANVIKQVGKEILFDEELASEWRPLQDGLVVVDPLHSFGAPRIQGRNLRTSTVYGMYLAEGRSIEIVCDWYNLREDQVNDAIRFEEMLAAGNAA